MEDKLEAHVVEQYRAAIERAAQQSRDPTLKEDLSAASSIFAVLARRDAERREMRAILEELANSPTDFTSLVARAARLVGKKPI